MCIVPATALPNYLFSVKSMDYESHKSKCLHRLARMVRALVELRTRKPQLAERKLTDWLAWLKILAVEVVGTIMFIVILCVEAIVAIRHLPAMLRQ